MIVNISNSKLIEVLLGKNFGSPSLTLEKVLLYTYSTPCEKGSLFLPVTRTSICFGR